MKFTIMPYVDVNGLPTMSNMVLIDLWTEMAIEGLVQQVFYTGEVRTLEEWLNLVKSEHNYVHVIWGEDKKPYMIAWLNGLGVNSAHAHFLTFPRAAGHTKELARITLDYWFGMTNNDAEPMFDVIIGKTPAHLRTATLFLRKIGMTVLGEIPKMAFNFYENKRVGLVISYIERGE